MRIVGDLSQPLPVRALARVALVGHSRHVQGPRIGAGDLRGFARLLVELGASEDLVSSMILAAKRTREPITVLVPLIWLESQQSQVARVCNEPIPESPLLEWNSDVCLRQAHSIGPSRDSEADPGERTASSLSGAIRRLSRVGEQPLRWRLSIRMGILFRAVLIGLCLDPSKPLASSPISVASVCHLRRLRPCEGSEG